MRLTKFIVPYVRLSKRIVPQNKEYETMKLHSITDENKNNYAIFNYKI
jgi:hypothetical protein